MSAPLKADSTSEVATDPAGLNRAPDGCTDLDEAKLEKQFGAVGTRHFLAALNLNANARRRAFGIRASGAPIVAGYLGNRPYSRSELLDMPWTEAAGIGVALRGREVILDVDHKDGAKEGWNHLRHLEEIHGPLPATARQATATGGAHFLFTLPEGTEGKDLSAHASLPDGTGAHIDVLKPSHRYVKVHDQAFWALVQPSDVAELPADWLPPLQRPHSTAPSGSRSAHAMPVDFSAQLDMLNAAQEGSRNDTLNRVAFRAFCLGHTEPWEVVALRDAAITIGLQEREVDATLESAWAKAKSEWLPYERWLRSLEAAIEGKPKRTQRRNRCVALSIVGLSQRLGGKAWITLGVRDAAEEFGVSHQSANKSLHWLVDQGLLLRRGGKSSGKGGRLGNANQYKIAMVKVDTSRPEDGGLSTWNEPFGIRSVPMGKQALLLRHDAFQRMGGDLGAMPTLPPSGADVLVALENGPRSIADLAADTGLSKQVLGTALCCLEQACLVSLDHGIASASYAGDATVGLDRWAQFKGLQRRSERRRKRHDQDRFQQSQYLMWKYGIPVEGRKRGRLKLVVKPGQSRDRVRSDVFVHINRSRGRALSATIVTNE